MVLTGESWWNGIDREVLVGWYRKGRVCGMVLTGECCWDGSDMGLLVAWD
jgi:hypothetical protein